MKLELIVLFNKDFNDRRQRVNTRQHFTKSFALNYKKRMNTKLKTYSFIYLKTLSKLEPNDS